MIRYNKMEVDEGKRRSEHQVAFQETEKIQEIQRYIQPANQSEDEKKRKDSRMLTATFSLTVILIFGVIVFSIWLSVEVGMNGRSIWSSGGRLMMYKSQGYICYVHVL